MADPEKLATLSAITGADDNAAHMILNSFNGDLERAVDYVMENGEQGVAALSAFTPVSDAAQALEASDEEPIDLSSPSPMAQAAARHAAEVQLRNRGWQEEEAALQQALAASKMTAGAEAGRGSGTATPAPSASQRPSSSGQEAPSDSDVEEYEPSIDSDVEMDTEEEYLRKLAAAQHRQVGRASLAAGAGPSGANGAGPSSFALDDGDDAGPRIRHNRPSGAAAGAAQHMQALNALSQRLGVPMPPMGIEADGSDDDSGAGPGPAAMGGFGGFTDGGFNGGRDVGLPDMPAGVDVEEARMLEAAMLGIPYTGHIPDFANGAGAAAAAAAGAEPLSPGLRTQRALKEEQDWAYQQSLQADREKALAEEVAQRAAEAEADRQRQEAEAAEAAAAEAAEHHERLLVEKAEALPEEPPEGPDVVTVLVRLPTGQRLKRRFRTSDALQALYDFVDTSGLGEDRRPGTYSLVTSMPRQVHEEMAERTLADAGLTQRQEMLMLEPKG